MINPATKYETKYTIVSESSLSNIIFIIFLLKTIKSQRCQSFANVSDFELDA